MSVRKLIAGAALLSVAATAEAGWTASLPESATVTLIFVALAVVAFTFRRSPDASLVRADAPEEAGSHPPVVADRKP